MESKIVFVIEEQISVQFTGKVNILAAYNRQYLGHILFKDGEIIQVTFQGHKGLKAFYQLMIAEYSLQSFDCVVEPEVVDEKERQIHYPYSVIKNKLSEIIKLHHNSLKYRPPDSVKILVDPEFLDDIVPVEPHEFSVLETLTEYNTVYDVYQHCKLLDHEITWALVSLRKKGALKTIASR